MKTKYYNYEICYTSNDCSVKSIIIEGYSEWIVLDEFKDMRIGDFISIVRHNLNK